MSVELVKVDRDQFALDWLPTVKKHCRVEFDRDDEYILGLIARAADQVERTTGQNLVPRTELYRPDYNADYWPGYLIRHCSDVWAPFGDYAGAWGWRLPIVGQIRSFGAIDDDGDDRSPAWKLIGDLRPQGVTPRFLVRANVEATSDGWTRPSSWTNGWRFWIKTGARSAGETDPGLADVLLRLCAHMYENRELMVGTSMQIAPDFLDQAFSTLWVPRC